MGGNGAILCGLPLGGLPWIDQYKMSELGGHPHNIAHLKICEKIFQGDLSLPMYPFLGNPQFTPGKGDGFFGKLLQETKFLGHNTSYSRGDG